jgi:hypothetical protein
MNRREHITKAAYEVAGISVRDIMPFINMEGVKTVCSQCALHCFQTIETRNRLLKKQGDCSCLIGFVSEE